MSRSSSGPRQHLTHLVNLPLLLLGAGRQGAAGRDSLRGVTQSEIGITEVPVSLHVVKRFPDQTLLLQEALVRHQQVQVTLRRRALLTTARENDRRV